MKLRELAHSRTGDKGNISVISVIAWHAEDYPRLKAQVTAQAVAAYFQGVTHGSVHRYEVPGIHALNFVLEDTLGGGVTRSLALDAHGKCLSYALLEMELPPWDNTEAVNGDH